MTGKAATTGQILHRFRHRFYLPIRQSSPNTYASILDKLDQSNLKTICNAALNEHDCCDLFGLNKDEGRARLGEEKKHNLSPVLGRYAHQAAEPSQYQRTSLAGITPTDIRPRILRDQNVRVVANAIGFDRWSWFWYIVNTKFHLGIKRNYRQSVRKALSWNNTAINFLTVNSTLLAEDRLMAYWARSPGYIRISS